MTGFAPSPEQKEVIEYPLAPLRVAAGAGSGKTGTMALRLAHFVRTGVVEPEEALGITFTNKAAGELADRLRTTLPEAAAEGREVEVTTYHGFAHGLLREFGSLVGTAREVRIVTPGYTRQLMRDAIADAPRPLLDLTQAGKVVDRVARLASTLGDHLLSVAALFVDAADDVSLERNALAEVLAAYERRKRAWRRRLRRSRDPGTSSGDGIPRSRRTNPQQISHRAPRRVPGHQPRTAGVAAYDLRRRVPGHRGWRHRPDHLRMARASPHNFASFPEHFPRPDGKPADSKNLAVTWRSDIKIVNVANTIRNEPASPR